MIISDSITVQYEGQPAQLSVVRNDGFCWGRLVTASGVQLDVTTEFYTDDDPYDEDDEEVLVWLMAAMDEARAITPAQR